MKNSGSQGASAGTERESKVQYLTFFIAGEEYGVPLLRVREILEWKPLTRVPAAPPCVRGVINLRGRVVPVADLGVQFRQPECAITKLTCVVVVEVVMEGELTVMGLMVESVNQTIELGPDEIEAAPAFGTLARTEYLTGMGRSDDSKFVLLLDLDRVLSAEELSRAAAAAEQAPEPGASQAQPR